MTINVIIADDHQLFIDGIKSILQKVMNVEVIGEANNGLEILKMLEGGVQPDIIITDIRMPILDGVGLTRRLTLEHPKIKVLALSMFDQTVDVTEMLDVGAKGYVTKNVDKDELELAINTLVKGEYYFSKNLPESIKDWFNKEKTTPQTELTKRETEILQLVVKGRTSIEIAKHLKLSKFTIDTHRKNIHKKLGIKSNTGLVNYAIKYFKP